MIVAAVLACSMFSTPQFELRGIPVDRNQVETVMLIVETLGGKPVPDGYTITFVKGPMRVELSDGKMHDVVAYTRPAKHEMVVSMTYFEREWGLPATTCVAITSLGHELLHAVFDDAEHQNHALFGAPNSLEMRVNMAAWFLCPQAERDRLAFDPSHFNREAK